MCATLMPNLPQADMRKVVWNSNVYEPSDDSYALVDAVLAWLQQQIVHQQPQKHAYQAPEEQMQPSGQHTQAHQLPQMCLEVGCGSGYVICSAVLALQHTHSSSTCTAGSTAAQADGGTGLTTQGTGAAASCSFIATDINTAALEATAATLKAHGVEGVELVQTDLVAGLLPRLAGAVDLLLFNPPYVPTPDEEVERDGIARAWAGGHMGRRVTDRLLAQLPELLSPSGHAFIVTVADNKPQEILSMLELAGLQGEVALTRAADEEHLQILHVWRK